MHPETVMHKCLKVHKSVVYEKSSVYDTGLFMKQAESKINIAILW